MDCGGQGRGQGLAKPPAPPPLVLFAESRLRLRLSSFELQAPCGTNRALVFGIIKRICQIVWLWQRDTMHRNQSSDLLLSLETKTNVEAVGVDPTTPSIRLILRDAKEESYR